MLQFITDTIQAYCKQWGYYELYNELIERRSCESNNNLPVIKPRKGTQMYPMVLKLVAAHDEQKFVSISTYNRFINEWAVKANGLISDFVDAVQIGNYLYIFGMSDNDYGPKLRVNIISYKFLCHYSEQYELQF